MLKRLWSDARDAVSPAQLGRARAGVSADVLELVRRESARAIAACNAADTLAATGQDESADARAIEATDAARAITNAVADEWRMPLRAQLDSSTTWRARVDAVNAVIRAVARDYAEPGGPRVERAYRLGAIAVAVAVMTAIIVRLGAG